MPKPFLILIFDKTKRNKMITLKRPHDGTILQKLIDRASSMKYHTAEIAPYLGEMEAWEAKEYKQVHQSNVEEFDEYRKNILKNPDLFNGILVQYGHTVESFIKEIQK